MEHFPNSTGQFSNYYDFLLTVPGEPPTFAMTALNNNTYLVTGHMNHTANQAVNIGIPATTVLSWDLTINRMYVAFLLASVCAVRGVCAHACV